jgi:NTE family protein
MHHLNSLRDKALFSMTTRSIRAKRALHFFSLTALCASCALFVGGCAATGSASAPFNYLEKDAPIALETIAQMQPRPRIAVVLGSGGPRGYAHVGAMRVLEEAGITPDLIVGSSVGSLLGVFWASGLSAEEIDKQSFEGGPLTLFDISPLADRGWIRGQRLQNYVNDQLTKRQKAIQLEQLQRRVIVVATKRGTREARFFMSGNAGVAVRASSAVPTIFSPVGINNVEYEDGDESLPVAVSAARAAGAEFVIAIDVAAKAGSTPADASDATRLRDVNRRKRIDPEVAKADFLIHPDLDYGASPLRSYFIHARRVGESSTRKILPQLQDALKNAQIEAR